VVDRLLTRLTASPRLTRWLIPLVRAYIRYVPLAAGKRSVWERLVNPYLAWEPHRFVARTVFGSEIAGDAQDILTQYVYYFGVWEPHITRWVRRRLRQGDTFIDVGANIGYYTLLASRCVGPAGRVVAIEASPTIFRALQDNLARNRVRNVRAVNVAASDRRGVVRLFLGPVTNRGLTTMLPEEAAKYACEFECEVQAGPLAAILGSEEVRRARLIKIDVEGAEWPVVEGLAPLLEATRPDLEVLMELSPERLAHQGKEPEDVLRVFGQAGFRAYSVANDYTAGSYLTQGRQGGPLPLGRGVECETDVLFSRAGPDGV